MARSLEQQLADIEERFRGVKGSCDQRGKALREVGNKLKDFDEKLNTTLNWLNSKAEELHSSDLNAMLSDEANQVLENISREKMTKDRDIAKIKVLASELKTDPRTGSPAPVDKAVVRLEQAAAELTSVLEEKQEDVSKREQQTDQFESAKTLMQLWLAQMESRLDELEPVAIEVKYLEAQISELQVSHCTNKKKQIMQGPLDPFLSPWVCRSYRSIAVPCDF